MRCYFQETGTVEIVPIEKIFLAVGVGIHGVSFLQRIEKDQEESSYAWGAKRIDGVVYLESFCVNIEKIEGQLDTR